MSGCDLAMTIGASLTDEVPNEGEEITSGSARSFRLLSFFLMKKPAPNRAATPTVYTGKLSHKKKLLV